MQFTVTKEHIKRGKWMSSYAGPVALAINECLHVSHAYVGSDIIHIGGQCFDVPTHVRRFMGRFNSSAASNRCRGITFCLPIEEAA